MTQNEPVIGYFGPQSMTWRLYREPLFLLGGVRALLLQVAHPAVADGVARFSNFQQDPYGRGYRTFEAMATIYFGTCAQADATAARLRRMHDGIRGTVNEEAYYANQVHLLCWVLSTLTETTLQVYEWLPDDDLPADWREQFYEESKIAAAILGIQKEAYPADLEQFRAYWSDMLHGDTLGSSPTCQAMTAAIVLHPKVPTRLARLLSAGWLPQRLCTRIGLDASPNAEEKLQRFLRKVRWGYRLLPAPLRYNPAWHQAQYRIARAQFQRPGLLGRFYFWLGKKIKIPLGIPVIN
jgi:uncharacterized protein (DUF2236 family)